MEVELIGFEEEAAKDWQDSQVLSIGQMYDIWSGRHRACARKGVVLSQDWGRDSYDFRVGRIGTNLPIIYTRAAAPPFR